MSELCQKCDNPLLIVPILIIFLSVKFLSTGWAIILKILFLRLKKTNTVVSILARLFQTGQIVIF